MSDFESLPAPPPARGAAPIPPASGVGPVPTGYVAFGQGPQSVPEPKGWRTATIVGFAAVTALAGLLGVLAYLRGDTVADFFNGTASIGDVQDADDQVSQLAITLIVAQVAAAIALAVWSYRTTKAAAERFPRLALRPGLAAGSWFIPFANYYLPWKLLREASTTDVGAAPKVIGWWQALFCGQAVLSWVGNNTGEFTAGMSQQEAIDTGHRQGYYFMAVAVLLAAGTVVAAKATAAVARLACGTGVAVSGS